MNVRSSLKPLRSRLKRSLPAMCIATSVLMMTACASSTMPLKDAPQIPPNLMQECRMPTKLEGKTGADVERKIVELAGLLHECADGKRELIKAVK